MRFSRFLVHHQPPLGSPGPCPRDAAPTSAAAILSHTQPLGSVSVLQLLGGCSFKAQIYLLKMLLFRDRELTATAHAQQPGGRPRAMEAVGDRVLQGSHPILWPMTVAGHFSGILASTRWSRQAALPVGAERWHLNEGTLNPDCAVGRGHALKPCGHLLPQTLTLTATFSCFGCLQVTEKLLQV